MHSHLLQLRLGRERCGRIARVALIVAVLASWAAPHRLLGVATEAAQAVSTRDAAGKIPRDLSGKVVYVVDGDTIHVQLGDRVEKVRYIGVNAPEVPHPHAAAEDRRRLKHFPHTVAAGEAAKRVNVDLVGGQHVRLELDRQRRDRWKRLLAYVWVGETMINAEMVKRGYAEVMSIPPDLHHRTLLEKAEADARTAKRGLWGDAKPKPKPQPKPMPQAAPRPR